MIAYSWIWSIGAEAEVLVLIGAGLAVLLTRLLYSIAPRVATARYRQTLLSASVLFWIAGFLLLASQLHSGALRTLDEILSTSVVTHAGDGVLSAFRLLTRLGDKATVWIVAAVIVAITFRRRLGVACGALLVIGGNGLITDALKMHFHRLRPPDAGLDTWSFPSGHSSGSVATYGYLAYLSVKLLPQAYHFPAVAVATLAVYGVACSRVFLGKHFPSDVLAGISTGLAWLSFSLLLLEYLNATVKTDERRKQQGND